MELGNRSYEGIPTTVIPTYNPQAHDVFLTKVFDQGKGKSNWRIDNVNFTTNGVEIFLKGFNALDSVENYARKQNKKVGVLLRKHFIVEVDFGHQSSLFHSNGGTTDNTSRTDALMPGEMHKKRPCIVMKVKKNAVTVIPLTTKNYNDPNHLKLSANSFNNMHERYKEKASFASLDKIQTVSACRIFPPRDVSSGQYKNTYHRYKLCSSDATEVDNKLAAMYNSALVTQCQQMTSSLASVRAEKSRLLTANSEMNDTLKVQYEELGELKALLDQFAGEYGVDPELSTLEKVARLKELL